MPVCQLQFVDPQQSESEAEDTDQLLDGWTVVRTIPLNLNLHL